MTELSQGTPMTNNTESLLRVPTTLFTVNNSKLAVTGGSKIEIVDFPVLPYEYIESDTNSKDYESFNLIGGGSVNISKQEYPVMPMRQIAGGKIEIPAIDYVLTLVKNNQDIITSLSEDVTPYPMYFDIETTSSLDSRGRRRFSRMDKDQIISIQLKFDDTDIILLINDTGTKEKEILEQFMAYCVSSPTGKSPDICVGYNNIRFDGPYILKRMEINKIGNLFKECGKVGVEDNIEYSSWQRRPYGVKDTDLLEMCIGLPMIDLYQIAKNDVTLSKLTSRTLKNVSNYYGSPDVFDIEQDEKSDMLGLYETDIDRFLKYAESDIVQTNYLWDIYKHRLIGASNLLSCPLTMVHWMSSGQKSYLALYRESIANKYFSLKTNGERYSELYDRSPKYQGAIVGCYQRGYFGSTVHLDAKCLHGSTMIPTDKGYTSFRDTKVGDTILYNGGYQKIIHKEQTTRRDRKLIRTETGNEIIGSNEHRFPIYVIGSKGKGDGKVINKCVADLRIGDIMMECCKYTIPQDNQSVPQEELDAAFAIGVYHSEVNYTCMELISEIHGYYNKFIEKFNSNPNLIFNNVQKCVEYIRGIFYVSSACRNTSDGDVMILEQPENGKVIIDIAHKCLVRCGIPYTLIKVTKGRFAKNKEDGAKFRLQIPAQYSGTYLEPVYNMYRETSAFEIRPPECMQNAAGMRLSKIKSVVNYKAPDIDDMYDIMVESENYPYFFANNILSHNSMYPNIMYDFNISYDRYKLEEVIEYEKWYSNQGIVWNANISLDTMDVRPEIEVSGIPTDKCIFIPDDNYHVILKIKVDLINDGFMRKLIEHFNSVRDEYKRLSKSYNAEGQTGLSAMYNSYQAEAKVVNNTFYGIQGNKYYEVADLPAAIMVTAIGRWIMTEMINMFKDEVISTDTDGILLDKSKITISIDEINDYLRNKIHQFFGVPLTKMKFMLEFEDEGSVYMYKMKNYILKGNSSNDLLYKGSAFVGYGKAPVLKRAVKIMGNAVMSSPGDSKIFKEEYDKALNIFNLPDSEFLFTMTIQKRMDEYKSYEGIYMFAKSFESSDNTKEDFAITKRRAKTWIKNKHNASSDIAKKLSRMVGESKNKSQLDFVMNFISGMGNDGSRKISSSILDIMMGQLSKGVIIEEGSTIQYYYTLTSSRYTVIEDMNSSIVIDKEKYLKETKKAIDRFKYANPEEGQLDFMSFLDSGIV